jgi:hypothetical protein
MRSKTELNRTYVEKVGLEMMNDSEKDMLLEYVYQELVNRVRVRLIEGMPDRLIDELEYFIDKNVYKMERWLEENMPDYENHPIFIHLLKTIDGGDRATILSEFGIIVWLNVRKPNYRQIVRDEFEKLTEDIIAAKDQILAGIRAPDNNLC